MMNHNQNDTSCPVMLSIPYPPVQAESHCKDYGYAMLSNVGSDNSEMTAISLYFYNSVFLHPKYGDFAQCFHRISIVEMHHLNIFATLAYQLGLDPRLWSRKNNDMCYWTPAYNCYPRMVRAMIENAIQGEQAAIEKYTEQAETIQDANIVENLHRIILDEQHHIEVFHSMLAKIL